MADRFELNGHVLPSEGIAARSRQFRAGLAFAPFDRATVSESIPAARERDKPTLWSM